MLPLGVVIPTKNSRPYLPAHLDGLRSWLDQSEQVVVVDSFSTDGTIEYLREHLAHPRVSFLTHPPGLYDSWNHGIAHIRSPFVFMATTGDLITRPGLEKLLHTAQSLDCDVVISKPTFRDPAGRALPDIPWPIDDLIATLRITQPSRLHKLEAMLFAATHATGALLGSSASNVYRTQTLQKFPFPTTFRGAGDGIWGLLHAPEIRWGVVPERFSSFLVHPPTDSTPSKSVSPPPSQDKILREATEQWLANGTVTPAELESIKWTQCLQILTEYLDQKNAFDDFRHQSFPWVLNPAAIIARWRRNRARRQLHTFRLLGTPLPR
jgi:hypothetical protein